MILKIECMDCWRSIEMLPTPAEDAAQGWKRRIVTIRAKKPEDLCGASIPDGIEAKAVTMLNENREDEPPNWERDYE